MSRDLHRILDRIEMLAPRDLEQIYVSEKRFLWVEHRMRIAVTRVELNAYTEQQAADIAESIRLVFAELIPELKRALPGFEENADFARRWRNYYG